MTERRIFFRRQMFAMYANAGNHHGAGHHAVWVKSTIGNQQLVIRSDPDRFFSPPYVGPSGWIGARLDGAPDWDEIAALLRDGYALVAPKRLLSLLDESD